MDRTVFGNLEQSASLCIIQVTHQFDLTVDSVEKTFFRFAVDTVLGVNAEVLKTHRYAPQIPLFTLRIQAHCHRRACAKRGQKKVVGRRSGVRPERRRFISSPSMFARGNFLG